jgi:hypothetical protein
MLLQTKIYIKFNIDFHQTIIFDTIYHFIMIKKLKKRNT